MNYDIVMYIYNQQIIYIYNQKIIYLEEILHLKSVQIEKWK